MIHSSDDAIFLCVTFGKTDAEVLYNVTRAYLIYVQSLPRGDKKRKKLDSLRHVYGRLEKTHSAFLCGETLIVNELDIDDLEVLEDALHGFISLLRQRFIKTEGREDVIDSLQKIIQYIETSLASI